MRVLNEKNRCHWCTNEKFKTELDFDVVDEASGQFVHPKLIKFCPFCGRNLSALYLIEEAKNEDGCVCCGETVPEGRQICKKCELKLDTDNSINFSEN